MSTTARARGGAASPAAVVALEVIEQVLTVHTEKSAAV
jgi:hypothetical protein